MHMTQAGPGDLEALLSQHPFLPELLRCAAALRAAIVTAGIGQYGRADRASLIALPRRTGATFLRSAVSRTILVGPDGRCCGLG